LGSRFEVFVVRGGVETKVYENLDWDDPLYQVYDPPLELATGDQLKFSCTWHNTTPRWVRFGTSKDDEMCILGGYIYPAADLTVTCGETG